MTPAEYAQRQGVSTRTVERWLAAGQLPTASQGPDGRWHIPADAVRQQSLAPRQPTDVSVTRRSVSVVEPEPRRREVLSLADALGQLPAFLTVVQAARLLGIPEASVRRHAAELDGRTWGAHGALVIPAAAVRRLAGL